MQRAWASIEFADMPMLTMPQMSRRGGLAAAIVLAGALVVATGAWLLLRVDPVIGHVAALELGCPESQIEVVASHHTDTGETHEVRGCGKTATVLCAMPDFTCAVIESGIIPRTPATPPER